MNAPARIAAFLSRSALRGTERDRAAMPSSSRRVDGTSAPTARRLALATTLTVALTLVLGAVPALGAQTHPFQGTLDTSGVPGGVCCLSAIAADASGGDLYTADSAAPQFDYSSANIYRFSSAGAFDSGFDLSEEYELEVEPGVFQPHKRSAINLLSPTDVAIDDSGTASDGTIYVSSGATNEVLALSEAGELVPGFAAAGRLNGSELPTGGFANPDGLAVDPATGNLFVSDQGHNRIWIFDSSGAYLDRIADSSIVVPGGLAFDSTGENLYIRTGLSCYCDSREARVLRFHRSSATEWQLAQVVSASDFQTFQNLANDVALDTATNHVYVDYGDRIREYDESGAPVNTFGQGHIFGSASIAVDPESGKLYAAEGATVYTFGPLATTTPPIPSIDPVGSGGITAGSAHLTGTLDPQGFESTYRFEYSTDHANWTSLGDQAPLKGTGAQAVEGEATGLAPHTEYFARLFASNGVDEPVISAEVAFTTEALAPTVTSTFVESVGDDGATLNAKIVPGGAPTTYHFQYLTLAQFEANGETFTGATSTPESVSIGEDNTQHIAFAPIGGLKPDTSYVYRAVATNAKGTIEGDIHQLHTFALPSEAPDTCPNSAFRSDQQSAFLPDCRAYEMVSPPDKRGGDVVAMTERTHMATDGNAASFASLVPFGDAIGTGVATEYLSLRDGAPGTNGWATHAITPLQEGMGANEVILSDPLYVGDLSDDLSRGVFLTQSPLTNDPSVAEVPNLYLRDDLRTPGAGTYQLLSACPLCDLSGPLPAPASTQLKPLYAGASDDFTHVLFQQKVNLTSDAPPQSSTCAGNNVSCIPRAYEWSGGQLSLAGLVPPGYESLVPPGSETSCGGSSPACVVAEASMPGGGNNVSISNRPLNVISADGSRFFFTVPMRTNGEIRGSEKAGKLYMRTADTTTDQLNLSERAECVGNPGDPGCFTPAQYLTSSADGSRVFFQTARALTDDAPDDNQPKLYMYDATKPPTDPHNLTFISLFSSLVNASEDGSYVYFILGNQVELWHEGTVADVGGPAEVADTANTGTNAFILTHARVSSDGHHLLLPLHNSQGFRELYLYSADSDELTCVSCPTDGTTPTGDAQVAVRENKGAAASTWHLNRALSADGNVFFTSPDPLVAADTNGRKDAYAYDAQTAQLHLLSSGTSKSDSYFLEADPDGSNALIVTRQQLLSWDSDTSSDLYDARVNGGFPEPAAVPAPCSADTCRSAVPPAPNPEAATTVTFAGPENETGKPGPRCPKGKHVVKRHSAAASKQSKSGSPAQLAKRDPLKKSRCVKNKRRAHTRANSNRRASK